MSLPFDLDTAKGMLLGLALGDGPSGPSGGTWADSTSMALCLGESLLHCKGWKADDCARRFVRLRDEGYMSPHKTCVGMDATVSAALDRFLRDGDPYAGDTNPNSASNGGTIRLAPAVIAHHRDAMAAVDVSVLQSQITHATDECDDFAFALSAFLHSGNLSDALHRLPAETERPQIESSISVRESYEAAFWAFETTDSFRDCIVLAGDLAGDTGKVGAIAGQIAGRVYGMKGIPSEWLATLVWRERIEAMAANLYALGS
jgi:ADP-ribosyl-[dinitrogen reductase] hydrolase